MPAALPPLRPGPVTADAINRRIGERVREIYGDNQIIECRRNGDVVNVILRIDNLLPFIPKTEATASHPQYAGQVDIGVGNNQSGWNFPFAHGAL